MYRVLLVDDEVLVREAIGENIHWEELGYELAGSCQDGKEAKEFLERNPVDVVLTDICMPHMDGMELSELIYEQYPEVNVIIFSGFDDFEYAKKAIRYNVKEYLLKPVTAFELSEVLTNLKEKIDSAREKEKKLERLSETYNKNRIIIKSKVLADFIMGTKTEEENLMGLREVNVVLEASEFRVAVLEIDLYSELHDPDEEAKQQSALMAFAVFNISDEIIKAHQAGIVCQGNHNRVFILFQTDRPKGFDESVKNTCLQISDLVKQLLGLSITIGIGREVRNKKDIYKSYEEAEGAIRYRYLLGGDSIIDMKEIIRAMNKEVDLDEEIDQLSMALKLNDRTKTEEGLDKISKTVKDAMADKNRSCLYLQQVIVAVGDVLRTSDLAGSMIYAQKDQLLTDIAEARTFADSMKMLEDYCHQAGEELDNQKNAGGKRQAFLAMNYMEKNYSDDEMNLNSICTYLCISPSRFSTIFKNATGETFMEALTRIRMQKAKELLENTDLKNYEIAEKVGFSDPHYFSIAFKKATGKTPKEYAKGKR